MKFHNILRTALFCAIVLQSIDSFAAETTFKFRTKNRKIYHKGWIDLNKNGVKDVYEDIFMETRESTSTAIPSASAPVTVFTMFFVSTTSVRL